MYDFRSLSPLDFENLVRDLLQLELNLRIESFGPGRDGGIDFRCAFAEGTTVIQVKHYVGSPFTALRNSVAKENEKVRRLKPSRYVLVTSSTLTPASKDRLIAVVPDAPLQRDDVLGREDLNNLLGKHPQIERQHFKLWLASTSVLERMLHSGVYNRTEAELEVIKALVPKFVHNKGVPRAEEILERSSALIIAGEPGVGKTTLARMLIWLHAAQDWRIFVVDDFKEAMTVSTAGEKRLIFFDDFLGQINLTDDQIREVDQRFPVFLDRLKGNKDLRFILTTRDYLLNRARNQSGRLASTRVRTSEMVLNVGEYTRAVRAQIVFNHIYFSDLAQEERKSLLAENFYLKMIDHRNFSPRLIELLTSAEYHSIDDRSIRHTVQRVLDNPSELWEKPYRSHFSQDARVLMCALFFSGYYVSVEEVLDAFKRFAAGSGITLPEAEAVLRFRHAVKEIEGSVLAIRDKRISFSNPGIRDFLEKAIIDDRLIATTVRSVAKFRELDGAWSFFCRHRSECEPHLSSQDLWVDALSRVVGQRSGSAINRVRLALEICAEVRSEELNQITSEALENLSQEGIDSDEVTESRWTLERIQDLEMVDDRHPVATLAKPVVTRAIAEMLKKEGGYLTLDEIGSLASDLVEATRDPDMVRGTATLALKGFMGRLGENLSEVSSTSELDSFEGELQEVLRKYDIEYGYSPRYDVESRRETLRERESSQEDAGYRPVRAANPAEISDAEIASLFSTIERP